MTVERADRESGFGIRDPQNPDELLQKAAAAKHASLVLAQASTKDKNRALLAMARAIRAHAASILAANANDCAHANEPRAARGDGAPQPSGEERGGGPRD